MSSKEINPIRSPFSKKHRVYQPAPTEPTRTKQEFKDDVCINTIIRRMKNGQNPPQWMTSQTPHYGDFADMPASFMEAHQIMEAGAAAFKSLPLEMRRELDHDPRNLDHAPRALFERFGLLKKPASQSPAPKEPGSSDGRTANGGKNSQPRANQAPKKGSQDPEIDSD